MVFFYETFSLTLILFIIDTKINKEEEEVWSIKKLGF